MKQTDIKTAEVVYHEGGSKKRKGFIINGTYYTSNQFYKIIEGGLTYRHVAERLRRGKTALEAVTKPIPNATFSLNLQQLEDEYWPAPGLRHQTTGR